MDYEAASNAGAVMLAILDDMEEILLTNEHFLLGRWISDARSFGSDDKVIIVSPDFHCSNLSNIKVYHDSGHFV